MSLTIGYDASCTLGPRTGIGRAALGMLEALIALEDAEARYAYRVFANSLTKSPGPEHAFLREAPADRVTFVRSRRPGPWLVKAWARGAGPTAERLLGDGLTLYHAPATYCPLATRAKLSVVVHDLAFLDDAPGQRDALGGGLFAEWFPRLLPACDLITTPSAFVRDRVLETYKLPEDRVAVVPWGIDTRLFYQEATRFVEIARHDTGIAGDDYILGVGAPTPRKRTGLMLDAYARLCERQPDTPPLVLLGYGSEPPAELRARPALHRRVQLAGRVSDKLLAGLYTGAVATLFPSASEGFGFPVLEAQACGSPVVCARATSLPEVGGDAATYVDGTDPEAWAEALERVVFDEAEHRRASDAGRANATRFTWEASARELRRLWESHLAWPGVIGRV